MAGGGSIRGVNGSIHWAYYVCARIDGYRVRRTKQGQWSLVARVLPGSADAYKMSQRPLIFVAPHMKPACACTWKPHDDRHDDMVAQRCSKCRTAWKPGEWSWPITSCEIRQGELRAQLGPPNP
jgi:hypothetical protein